MHANITLDAKVWREFRIACFKRGCSASKAIEQLLRRELEIKAPKLERGVSQNP